MHEETTHMKRCLAVLLSLILLPLSAAHALEETEGVFTVLDTDNPPAFVTERKLSDDEIARILHLDLVDPSMVVSD